MTARTVTRRTFLGDAGMFMLSTALIGRAGPVFAQRPPDPATVPSVFIAIDAGGSVRLKCHRSEMGQQVRTSLAQLIAEELEADWTRITIEQAEADRKYGDQRTDGSLSVRHNFNRLRLLGATARRMLEAAAAARWNLPVGECAGEMHQVVHRPSGRRLGYGELAGTAAALRVPALTIADLKPSTHWKLIGRSVPSVDLADIVTGRAKYALDMAMPGMRYAVVARPPTIFGAPQRFDEAAALAIPGVEAVMPLPVAAPPALFQPLGGVAVVASDPVAALRGREALGATWRAGPYAAHDHDKTVAELLAKLRTPGVAMRRDGDPDAELARAERIVAADYVTPYLAHTPIEPPCAIARVAPDGCQIWAPVQNPQSAIGLVAQTLGIDRSKVRVEVTMLGGAFGRKSQMDFVAEAALIAKARPGTPIKLLWTRDDDIRHGYYHPMSCQRIEAAVGDGGAVTAWRHRTAFPSISSIFSPDPPKPQDWELSQGVIDVPFAIPNIAGEAHAADAPIRMGWLRSVAAIFHVFAVNAFVAELAHELKRDPLDMLLALVGPPRRIRPVLVGEAKYANYDQDSDSYPIDTARIARVIRTAADMAGWQRRRPRGVGLGIAAHRSSGSYVATVIEVDARGDSWRVPAAYVAVDAGQIVNPDHAVAQCEGSTVMGLSCAMGAINLDSGAVRESSFAEYEVARMNSAPRRIDVRLIPSDHSPGGLGEPATPTVAPALVNALFAAAGRRIRRLPIGDQWA